MRAITLHAPWATLIAIGTKRWETRSWPCPLSIIGQRIAIHQAKRRPEHMQMVGDYMVNQKADGSTVMYHERQCLASGRDVHVDLPLGCIVASGVITRSMPIRDGMYPGPMPDGGDIVVAPSGLFDRTKNSSQFGYDLTDQEPYGDWSVGRWAWELSDVAATTDRCPWCADNMYKGADPAYGVGPEPGPGCTQWRSFWGPIPRCPVCRGDGKCDPIPAVGRQGFWNWDGRT